MRLVFAGTPQAAVPSLVALAQAGHEIAAVITRPAAPIGRSKKPVPSPVASKAEELGLRVIEAAKFGEAETALLQQLQPDLCPVVAYGALVPKKVLAIPMFGWVNVHFSLLPDWRGAAPVQRGIMAGDNLLGVSIFELVPELDAGPIYQQLAVDRVPDETAGEALERLSVIGADLLVTTLVGIERGFMPIPQPDGPTRYASKITPEDAKINWLRPADEIVGLILGASPAPGAWTTFDGQRFKVIRARVAATQQLEVGHLEATKKSLLVGTGHGDVELLEVQAFGKKVMRGADWARGVQLYDFE